MTDTLTYAPRMMQAPAAAFYLGVSVSTLRKFGIPRHKQGSLRLYDRIDLDAYASSMPLENKETESCEEADKAFG